MPQRQCPKCGRLGPRYDDRPTAGLTAADQRWLDAHQPGWDRPLPVPAWARPHADGSPCGTSAEEETT